MLNYSIIISAKGTTKHLEKGENKMEEKRLYNLAYDMLLMKWGNEHDFLEKYPNDEIAKTREKKLWNELIQLQEEMIEKKFA